MKTKKLVGVFGFLWGILFVFVVGFNILFRCFQFVYFCLLVCGILCVVLLCWWGCFLAGFFFLFFWFFVVVVVVVIVVFGGRPGEMELLWIGMQLNRLWKHMVINLFLLFFALLCPKLIWSKLIWSKLIWSKLIWSKKMQSKIKLFSYTAVIMQTVI